MLFHVFVKLLESRAKQGLEIPFFGAWLPDRFAVSGRWTKPPRLWVQNVCLVAMLSNTKSGWWQLKYFLFSPLLGETIQFDEHIFLNGLKPPTRNIWIYWILVVLFGTQLVEPYSHKYWFFDMLSHPFLKNYSFSSNPMFFFRKVFLGTKRVIWWFGEVSWVFIWDFLGFSRCASCVHCLTGSSKRRIKNQVRNDDVIWKGSIFKKENSSSKGICSFFVGEVTVTNVTYRSPLELWVIFASGVWSLAPSWTLTFIAAGSAFFGMVRSRSWWNRCCLRILYQRTRTCGIRLLVPRLLLIIPQSWVGLFQALVNLVDILTIYELVSQILPICDLQSLEESTHTYIYLHAYTSSCLFA